MNILSHLLTAAIDPVSLIIIIVAVLLFLVIFLSFVPIGLWISAAASGVNVGIFQLIGMRIRKVVPKRIVDPMIKATKAGLKLSINNLEAHYPCRRQRRPCCKRADSCSKGRNTAGF